MYSQITEWADDNRRWLQDRAAEATNQSITDPVLIALRDQLLREGEMLYATLAAIQAQTYHLSATA